MALSEYAELWDAERGAFDDILMDWVLEHPHWWAVVLATRWETAVELGAGFVDVLRFGEGLAEGTWAGAGKDVLRLLVIVGPLARAGAFASRALHLERLLHAVQVAGIDGPCTFQAVNNALSILLGKNLFMSLSDVARAMGRTVGSLTKNKWGQYELRAWIDDLVPEIWPYARVKEITGLARLEEIAGLVRRESGVVIFAIRARVAGVVDDVLHTVIAVRGPGGAIRYADYGGRFAKSLEELVTRLGAGKPVSIELYQNATSATVIDGMKLTGEYAARLARGAFLVLEGVTAIESRDEGVTLAVPVDVAAAPNLAAGDPTPHEVVTASYQAFKARRSGRVLQMPPLVIAAGKRTAPRADWLTGVKYRLNALGFGAGPVDATLRPRTTRAVRAFQKAYPPLRVDGVPGPATQARLVAVCGY